MLKIKTIIFVATISAMLAVTARAGYFYACGSTTTTTGCSDGCSGTCSTTVVPNTGCVLGGLYCQAVSNGGAVTTTTTPGTCELYLTNPSEGQYTCECSNTGPTTYGTATAQCY